jgi:hypothetical protein
MPTPEKNQLTAITEVAIEAATQLEPTPTPTLRVLPRTGEITSSDIPVPDRKRRKREPGAGMRRFFLTAIGVAGFMVLVYVGLNWWRESGMTSLSSSREESAEASKSVPTKYQPKQSHRFRASYTENVLYLESYVEAEVNPEFHNLWLTELKQEATNSWKLNDAVFKALVSREDQLIQDLTRISGSMTTDRITEGVERMKAREAEFNRSVDGLLKSPGAAERFFKFKRSFFTRYQAYLKKESI